MTIRVWMLYVLVMAWVARTTIFLRRRSGELYGNIDPMAMIQIFFVGAILVVLIPVAGKFFRRQIQGTSLQYWNLYLVLGMVSALWSVNPLFSLYRAVEVMALSTAVLYFCTTAPTMEENLRRVQIIAGSTLTIITLGTVIRLGVSVNLKNNELGGCAAIVATFFVAWILAAGRAKDRVQAIKTGLGVALVVMSMSLASWWSFWFGFLYCAFFTKRKALVIVLIVVGAGIFFSLNEDLREDLLLRDKSYENLDNLTGRRVLWEDYLAASTARPLLGFGFAMGAREVGKIYSTNTHNAFFAALMGVGWVGVVVLAACFVSLARELLRYRHTRSPVWLACAAALAAGCMNSMSLSIFGEQWNSSTTVFVSFLGLHSVLLLHAKKMRRNRPAKD